MAFSSGSISTGILNVLGEYLVTNAANGAGLPVDTKLNFMSAFDPATGVTTEYFRDPATGIDYPLSAINFQTDVMKNFGSTAAPSATRIKSVGSQKVYAATATSSEIPAADIPADATHAEIVYDGPVFKRLYHSCTGEPADANGSQWSQSGRPFSLGSATDIAQFRFVAPDGGQIRVEFRGIEA